MPPNRPFPRSVILEVPPYYALFQRCLNIQLPLPVEDFQEVMRQLIYEHMNYPADKVRLAVGFLIPDVNLMRDPRLRVDPVLVSQLFLATEALAAMLCSHFKFHDLVDVDGTVPYTPRNIHHDIVILDYVTGD